MCENMRHGHAKNPTTFLHFDTTSMLEKHLSFINISAKRHAIETNISLCTGIIFLEKLVVALANKRVLGEDKRNNKTCGKIRQEILMVIRNAMKAATNKALAKQQPIQDSP